MKLYSYFRSSCSWRVRIALHHKKLPFEYVPLHLLQGGGQQNAEAYRALNPAGTVPLLVLEEGGRVRRISQSLAILELLEELHPAPPLLPLEPFQRAHTRQLMELVNSGIQPLQNLVVQQYVKGPLQGDEKVWTQHWISRGLSALEALAAPQAGRFLVGDSLTLADVCLVPQLWGARRFGVDLSGFPSLARADATCAELPAFRAAHPDVQPDAQP